MNVKAINEHLFNGAIDIPGVFPHLDTLRSCPYIFDVEFGMPEFT